MGPAASRKSGPAVFPRTRGRVGERRPKPTADQAALARRLFDEREKTVQQTADMFGVPRSTLNVQGTGG